MASTNVGTTKMIKIFLFGLLAGAFGTVMAMQYHVVRTHERFMVVARIHQPPVRTAYVDVREWTPAMWEHYPDLSEAMVKAGRSDLLTRDGRATLPQAIPTGHFGPAQMGQPVRQQGMPQQAIPTSNPRIPPTAQQTHSFQTAGLEALAVTTPPPMDAAPYYRQQPVGQSSYLPPAPVYGSDPIRESHVPMGNHSAPGTEPAKRSWFGSILDSVIPKVGENVKENAAEFHSAAAVFSEQLEQLLAQQAEIGKEQLLQAEIESGKSPETPQVVEASPIPSGIGSNSVESNSIESQQSWKSVISTLTDNGQPAMASDLREEFPLSPRRLR
ncbi:MAG TPA: hypothetical protein VNQ76_18990 [Planctomicrobium sp.]|nr:hypothetical protein [Planctomicrobium sp.]